MAIIGKLVYDLSGAIDFYESVDFELSEENIEGFTEINPFELYRKIYLPHTSNIIMHNFIMIFGRAPHIADLNPDLPNRWRRIYYKCYKKYYHSHNIRDVKIIPLTIEEAMNFIRNQNLSINICTKLVNNRYSLNDTSRNSG